MGQRQIRLTLAELADLLGGLTPRRVQQLADEGAIPKPEERGRYELWPCVKGYIRYLKDRDGVDGADGGPMGDAKARLVTARARIAEIELSRQEASVVDVDAVTDAWTDACGRFRSRLINLPNKAARLVAAETTPDACQRILYDMVLEALSELHNISLEAAEPASTGDALGFGGDDAAAEADDL